MPVTVRPALDADLPALQAVYGHHVTTGLSSFEELPPPLEEFARRRAAILERGLPWLAAELDGRLAGYAYAGPYHARSAYRWTVEDSVYVAPGMAGRGAGTALLKALVEACTALGYRQMVAIVGNSANLASIRLHAAQGFRPAGGFASVGFKHGQWVDVVFMQRALGVGDATLPALRVPGPGAG